MSFVICIHGPVFNSDSDSRYLHGTKWHFNMCLVQYVPCVIIAIRLIFRNVAYHSFCMIVLYMFQFLC